MNVYTVMVAGEPRLYAAPSMARATDLAFSTYCDENELAREDENERRDFEAADLESVALIGALENVTFNEALRGYVIQDAVEA